MQAVALLLQAVALRLPLFYLGVVFLLENATTICIARCQFDLLSHYSCLQSIRLGLMHRCIALLDQIVDFVSERLVLKPGVCSMFICLMMLVL